MPTLIPNIFKLATVAIALVVFPMNAISQVNIEPAKKASKGTDTDIKGVVKDGVTGNPIAGVRVTVINEKTTVSTGDDGSFSLPSPTQNVTLKLTYPGYNTILVSASGKTTVNVKMQPATEATLYDRDILNPSAKGGSATFPIGQTTADMSVADLQGDLFSITRSGNPGAGHAVYVDGLHSLNTSSQPLYIVDGVEWTVAENELSTIDGHISNPLALISPDDIETIYVLKNGTAIYGAKGGNGVIVINTKRAHSEGTKIEAYARMGWRGGIKPIPVMDASQYRTYASDIISGKYKNSAVIDRLSFLNDSPQSSQYAMTHNNTDWLDLTTRTGLQMDYGVNVRGGDDRALYAFMLGYTKSDGAVKETSMNRINVRFNSDINLWTGAKLRFDVAYSQVDYHLFDDGMNALTSPYFLSMIKSPLYHPNVLTSDGNVTVKYSDVDELDVSNPMTILDMGKGESRNYRFNLNAAPRYKFNDNLIIEGNIAYTFNKLKENTFYPDYGVGERSFVNNTGEVYFTARNETRNLMTRHTTFHAGLHLDWTPLRNSVNDLLARVGYRYRNDTYTTSLGRGFNSSSDYINDLANTAVRETDGFDTQWRDMAWYLTARYSYLNRYLLGVDVTMESNSRFGKKAPGALHMGGISWGVFPSVNAAWILTSEPWMADAGCLNLLKLRIGWDMAGNDNLPYFANRTYFASEHLIGAAYAPVLNNLGNDKLKWEMTSTFRVGIDASLFNDRWQLSLDLYKSATNDLLIRKPLKEEAGLEYYWSNGGRLDNKGVNFSTTVRVLNTADWKLDFGTSIGHYKNEIKHLDDGDFITDIAGGQVLTAVGHPAGVFYGYKTDGVFATSTEAASANLSVRNANGSYTNFAAGDMHFADPNKDGIINEADRMVIGNPNPDFYGNFNLKLNWKHLTVGTMFTYTVGNDVYNALRANLESGSDIFNQSTAMTGRWVAEGQQTSIPRATYGDPMGNSRFSDRWIEDGSYLKWKSLFVEYNLPIKNPYVQGLTFSFEVGNLCTWTKYLGPDPEFYSGDSPLYMGVDCGLIPSTRTFNFGIKINL